MDPSASPKRLPSQFANSVIFSASAAARIGFVRCTAVVGHRYGQSLIAIHRTHDDGAALRRKLDGVLQEISEHLLQACRIDSHVMTSGRQCKLDGMTLLRMTSL